MMARYLRGLSLAIPMAWTPMLLSAAETAQEAADSHGGGGMPQLNTDTYVSQIFWLILTFGVLYYLLNKKLLPMLEGALQNRQERIAKDLDRAAELRKEAEEVYRGYEAVVNEAHAKAQIQIKGKRDAIAEEAAQRQSKLDAELGKKIADAEARIASERQTALDALQDVAVEVAQSATNKLIGVSVTKDEAKAALEAVVKEAA